MKYAGFWIRAAATIIDTLIIIAVLFPLLFAVYGRGYFSQEKTVLIAGPADFIISWVLPAVAVILFWTYKQATPGKMLLHLRILNAATGNKPSAAQFTGRYFAYIGSMLPLFLGVIWAVFDRRKQAWHDKLAGTVVVRTE